MPATPGVLLVQQSVLGVSIYALASAAFLKTLTLINAFKCTSQLPGLGFLPGSVAIA